MGDYFCIHDYMDIIIMYICMVGWEEMGWQLILYIESGVLNVGLGRYLASDEILLNAASSLLQRCIFSLIFQPV